MGEEAPMTTPQVGTVLFENEQVQILEVHVPPGERSELHIHPAFGFYRLAGGRLIRCVTRTDHQRSSNPAAGLGEQTDGESIRRRGRVTRKRRRRSLART